jgi:molybdopterin synthase catalytic subunit
MNFVKLVSSKLSVEEISDLVSSPSCGAISLFVGTTRDNFQNKKVRVLLLFTGCKDCCHEVTFAANPDKLFENEIL